MFSIAPSVLADEGDCDLTVRFGSYCCGPDPEAIEIVRRLLKDMPGVVQVTKIPWQFAREGEFDLCVETRDEAMARRTFDRIRQGLPATRRRGWQALILP